jgi:hypothetical protein
MALERRERRVGRAKAKPTMMLKNKGKKGAASVVMLKNGGFPLRSYPPYIY